MVAAKAGPNEITIMNMGPMTNLIANLVRAHAEGVDCSDDVITYFFSCPLQLYLHTLIAGPIPHTRRDAVAKSLRTCGSVSIKKPKS